MLTDKNKLTAEYGSSVLGKSFITAQDDSVLHVELTFNAWSEKPNKLAIAVFSHRQPTADFLHIVDIPANSRGYIETTMKIPVNGQRSMGLDVRAGPIFDGELIINGDSSGPIKLPRMAYLKLDEVVSVSKSSDPELRESIAQNIYTPGEAPIAIGRKNIGCGNYLEDQDAALIFTFGQSQAANSGKGKYTPKHDVANLNIMDMECYDAEDPVLGASNNGASIWNRMADRLIEAGAYEKVIISSVAYGGTYIKQWTNDGDMHRRLMFGLKRLKRNGIKPTAFLWHQGEAEAGLKDYKKATYVAAFESIRKDIRDIGFGAPIFVAQSTVCGNMNAPSKSAVRAAQGELAEKFDDIHKGADTDVIGLDLRFDTCHFGSKGLDQAAALWADAILK